MASIQVNKLIGKLAGLFPTSNYANLEALLNAEYGKPQGEFRIWSWVLPPIIAIVGTAISVLFAATISPLFLFIMLLSWITSVGAWFAFDHLDKAVSPSKREIRRKAEMILAKLKTFGNISGTSPALSPGVGEVMDHAAGIYLKYSDKGLKGTSEPILRAFQALEQGMSQILDLGVQPSLQMQDSELRKGWATTLLEEMKALDQGLDRIMKLGAQGGATGPLTSLREARMELQGLENAIAEVNRDEHQSVQPRS